MTIAADLIADIEVFDGFFTNEGTGFLVGPNDLLTAAHVVLSGTGGPLTYPFSVRIGGVTTTARVAGWFDFESQQFGFNAAGEDQYDIALLTLNDPIGEDLGYFELSADPADRRTMLTVGSYPAQTYNGNLYVEADIFAFYDDGFGHIEFFSSEVEGGSSGAPLFFEEDGVFTALGVFASGGGNVGYAGLFAPDTLEIIEGWIAGNDQGEGERAPPGTPVPIRDLWPDGPSTSAALASPGVFESAVDFDGDADWIRVSLEAGVAYVIALEGLQAGRGSLHDPYLTLYDASGAVVAEDDDSGWGRASTITYTPESSGAYFVAASAFDVFQGYYALTLSDDRADTVGASPDDSAPFLAGGVTSAIDVVGDEDWYATQLAAGVYRITLIGSEDGEALGPLHDPLLRVYDADGVEIAMNDDRVLGVETDSDLVFTALEDQWVYVSAGAWDTSIGAYRLAVERIGDAPAAETAPDARDVALFDATFYLGVGSNADLASAGITTPEAAFAHWFNGGFAEGRAFSPLRAVEGLFDEAHYRSDLPELDMEIADTTGVDDALDHYLVFGAAFDNIEGGPGQRDPNAFFDPISYLFTNPDVAGAVDFFGAPLDPFVHYLQFGEAEIIAGARSAEGLIGWDPAFYAAANPDVAAFIDAGPGGNMGLTSFLQHYVAFGADEGRTPLPEAVGLVLAQEADALI